jgi:threonine/homoserine/homoserine lactone efflux protein
MLFDFPWFLGVLTLGLLSPGPDFFLIVRNSLGGSRRRALGTVGGIATGLAVQGVAIALGFAAAPPGWLRGVQLAGAVFLAYVGVRSLLAKPAAGIESSGVAAIAGPDARSGAVEGLLCNLTNPKAFLFFVSLYAQMTRPGMAAGWRVAMPVTVVVHAIVCWSLIVLAVQSPPVACRLGRVQRWLPRAFGLALLALAAWVGWGAWLG